MDLNTSFPNGAPFTTHGQAGAFTKNASAVVPALMCRHRSGAPRLSRGADRLPSGRSSPTAGDLLFWPDYGMIGLPDTIDPGSSRMSSRRPCGAVGISGYSSS